MNKTFKIFNGNICFYLLFSKKKGGEGAIFFLNERSKLIKNHHY